MTNERIKSIVSTLDTIPIGGTTCKYGRIITRWKGGFELHTIRGENLVSSNELAQSISLDFQGELR